MRTPRRITLLAIATATLLGVTLIASSAANADTRIDGPIGLGTAEPFSVLAAATVTNIGPSAIGGDLGLSPGTSITGTSTAVIGGTVHQTDAVAAQAQLDLTTAYNVAASLTPIQTGLGDLTGSSLIPGVYSGGELALSGAMTLAGSAESVWIFQAASTLTVGSGAIITMTGGASACNVFWQVGTSATIGTGAQFIGTVMANESVSALTAATITGRLLARTGAVTLDTNTITAPVGCSTTAGTVTTSPTITSPTPPSGVTGAAYSYTATASGTPTATFSISSGALPTGLVLDAATGVISGTPTTAGTYTFAITASNGSAPDATTVYSVSIASPPAGAGLADSGADVTTGLIVGAFGLLIGACLFFGGRYRDSVRVRTSKGSHHG